MQYHLIKAFKNNTTNNVKRRVACYKAFARAYTFRHFIRALNEPYNQTHFPLKDPHENLFLWRFTHEAGQFITVKSLLRNRLQHCNHRRSENAALFYMIFPWQPLLPSSF